MRKQTFAAGLLALSFAACKQQDVIINTTPDKPSFRVSGISDLRVELSPFYQQAIFAQQQISVVYEYGDQKRVSLSIDNLPAGVKDSFYVRSGYPDFTTAVTYYNQGIQSGVYTPQFVVKADGDSAATRYPFNITVSGDTSCSGYFAGKTFESTSNCSGPNPNPPVPYTVTSTRFNGTDTLLLINYKNNGNALKVFINCRNRNVQVPMQTIGGSEVQGYGQLSSNNSNLPDVIYLSVNERDAQGNSTYCNLVYQLK